MNTQRYETRADALDHSKLYPRSEWNPQWVANLIASGRTNPAKGKTGYHLIADAHNAIASELRQQLLQAQAAIAEHNAINGDVCQIKSDFATLEYHDAEVRKPLVDALRRIQVAHTLLDASDISSDALSNLNAKTDRA